MANAERAKQKQKKPLVRTNAESGGGATIRKQSLNRQSSLNQLKELINCTVENLAERIKNFKEENGMIREKIIEDINSGNSTPLKHVVDYKDVEQNKDQNDDDKMEEDNDKQTNAIQISTSF